MTSVVSDRSPSPEGRPRIDRHAVVAARARRIAAVRQAMAARGIDAVLLSHGADLPWLTGYRAMPLERLTMLVLPVVGDPVLVVPELEAPRVPAADGLFDLLAWSETQEPVALVAQIVCSASGGRAGSGLRLAISERAWAATVVALQSALPGASWTLSTDVTGEIRAVKDSAELAALRAAAAAADVVAEAIHGGQVAMVGRSEAEVSADIGRRLIDAGHDQVNFAIVASGPNGASPHHEAGSRRLAVGDVVVCDFGGSLHVGEDVGYCSDITRTVVLGSPDPEVAGMYEVLQAAHDAAVAAVAPGVRAESVDEAARRVIDGAGLGDRFIHRTGHGIGLEEHEAPYIIAGNDQILVPGHAFSVEPGIYLPGRFGMRLEDIVTVTDCGVEVLNRADRRLVVVDG